MIFPAAPPLTDEDRQRIVERAQARVEIDSLLKHPGWERIQKQLLSQIETSMNALRRVKTEDASAALDAVRKWQLQNDNWEALCVFVNEILAPDASDDETLSPQEILLREELRHGRPTGDPGLDPASPAGH